MDVCSHLDCHLSLIGVRRPTLKTEVTEKPSLNTLVEEQDYRIGILVGTCIAVFFLLLFVVVCVVKEPCKKNKYTTKSTTTEEYLYHHLLETGASDPRLAGTRSGGTPSEESGESRKSKIKSKNHPFGCFLYHFPLSLLYTYLILIFYLFFIS